MSSYVRPAVDTPVFRDDQGQVIAYGNRWQGSPPQQAYSVDSHPERFSPVHEVADALIAHLCDTYDIELSEGMEIAADLDHPASDVVRAVRIRPNDPACAQLTFVFTGYPGVVLRAGLLHEFRHPECGCDACDETWESEADGIEQQVLAVVTGNYRETIEGRVRPWVEFELRYPGGATSGRSRGKDLSAERVAAARPVLRDLTAGWAAWPSRE